MLPERKTLPHGIPAWVEDGSEYFITICCTPRGKNQLCMEETAKVVLQTLRFYQDRGDLWLHLLVLMPDHLHAILSFNRDVGMEKSIREFKSTPPKKPAYDGSAIFSIIVCVKMNRMSKKPITSA